MLPPGIINDPTRTIDQSKSFRENRDVISDSILGTGGGIDPITGYTRRVMITMPWLNFQRPIFLEDLPNWSTFIAGIDSTPEARARLLAEFDKMTEQAVTESQTKQLYVIVMSTLVVLALAILGIIIYKKIKP